MKDVNEMLGKLIEEGKDPLDAIKTIENSGIFSKEIIDEWFDRFNEFRRGL